MPVNLSQIRHVEAQDPLAAEITSQPTRAIELQLQQMRQAQAAAAASTSRIVIPNVRIASSVALYNTVFFNPNTDQFEQGLAGVTVKSDTFTLNPTAIAVGIVVARKSSTVADIMVGGYDALDSTKKLGLLETGETFQPGSPLYLSAREPGKLTRFAPNFKVQVALTSDNNFIVQPVYSDPDAVEVTYRNPIGMRPVGSIRTLPTENVRYQIVGFDGLENNDIGNATVWRTTNDPASAISIHKEFGYMVADAVVTKQPVRPVYVRIKVARSTGVISCRTADSLADIETAVYNNLTLSAPNNLSGGTSDNVRTYVVSDRAGAVLGTLSFKFTSGDTTYDRHVYFKFPDSFQGWKMISEPSIPTAVASIAAGNVTQILVTAGGTGYTSAPSVSFVGGNGINAAAYATVDGGAVTKVTITNSGTGFTSTPGILFGGPGINAVAIAYIDGVTGIDVTHGSYGFTSPPTVVITGANTSPAAATAVINDSGIITGVTVTNTGSGYVTPPVITFTGEVIDATVTNGGIDYISAPNVIIDPPTAGTTAQADVVFSGVLLRRIERLAGGNNYTSDPTARLNSDDGGYHALLKSEISTNSIIEISMVSSGSGYDTSPVISFTGGGGCAVGTVVLTGGGGVATISVSQPGKGYTSPPTVVIKDPAGVNAVAIATLKAISAKPMLGGSGYLVGDSITLDGGTFTTATVVNVASVTSVNGIVGEITGVTVSTPGSYSVVPNNRVAQNSTNSVNGAGADFRVFWGVEAVGVTAPGTGYTGPATVSFANGGQVRATPIMDAADGIDRIVIGNGGAHFTSAPTVVLTGGDPAVDAVLGTAVFDGDNLLSLFTVTDPGTGFGAFGPGALDRITIKAGGSGYTTPPDVEFAGNGSGATALATLSGDKVISITVTNAGSGYLNPPLVTLTGGGGSGAEAVAYLQRAVGISGGGQAVSSATTITTGQVVGYTITNPGTGYLASFAASFIGGGGSLATASVTASAGNIISFTILTGGSGYTTAPTVDLTAGGGTSGVVVVTISNGKVVLGSVTATTPGTGYTHAPLPVFTSSPGGGATATAAVSGGSITTITVNAGGSRYLVAPKVILTGGGGTGALASANIVNGIVTTITVNAVGTGYATPPQVTFSMGSGAIGSTRLKAVSVTLGATGSSYAPADTINVAGGDYDTQLVLTVNTVGGGGDITSLTLTNQGSYKVVAPNGIGQDFTSGIGVGATFSFDWGIDLTLVTNGGANYPAVPVISFCGGGNAEAYFEPGGEVLDVTITVPGDGYTSTPNIVFTGGGGSGAAATAIISGAGGSHPAKSLQIRTFHQDFDDSPTIEFPEPAVADFFYNLFADPTTKSRWPSVPTEKTTFLINGLEALTGTLNEGSREFSELDCDVGLSRKTIFWTTSHLDACPWDRYYEMYRREPGTAGRDSLIPLTGDPGLDTEHRWWEHLYKYEPNRNKGWLYINRLSRFHQSGRVVSLAVESPLQLINLENGQDSGGRPLPGQLLLRLNNQANILSPPSPQIDMSVNGTTVAIYQNLTGRNVMVSSVILTTIFQLTGPGTVTTANNARVTVGVQAGNYRNIIGNLAPDSVIQTARDCRLIDQNQVKELLPDDEFAYTIIAPNEIVYLRVDEAAGGPIQSQVAVARLKGHVL